MKAASVGDYRELARRRLPRFLFDYIDGGSYGEVTLRRNVEDLQAISLRQRVLRDVSHIDLSCELFGSTFALPLALAPVGMGGLNARRGEVQAVRAAEQADVPFCLSTVGTCSISEVKQAAKRPFWFQLYMMRDRAFMKDLLTEVSAAGCTTLMFTVDLPVTGARYRDGRSGLAGQSGWVDSLRRLGQVLTRPQWAWDVGVRGRPHSIGNVAPLLRRNAAGVKSSVGDFFDWVKENFDPSVTWRDLDWLRTAWPGPLVLKGILDLDDAKQAVAFGAQGIVVSNHGGRQLDGTPSTARALPAIAEAVGEKLTVLVDGGIRSGLDVVRMLALGAKGVLIGRPWAYALAARGEAGVSHMLALFTAEMRVALSLTGCTKLSDVTRSILVETQ